MSEGLRGQKVLYRCRVLLIDGEKLELVSGHPQKNNPNLSWRKGSGCSRACVFSLSLLNVFKLPAQNLADCRLWKGVDKDNLFRNLVAGQLCTTVFHDVFLGD